MHIKEISQLFDIVPLETILQKNNCVGKLCTITFDDGWLDNYDIAFPILKKYRVPATIFIPVSIIGSNYSFWFESLFHLANLAITSGKEKNLYQYFQNVVPSWMPSNNCTDNLSTLISALKHLPGNTLHDLVAKAFMNLGIEPISQNTVLNWNQISEMGQHRITFGAHGLQHYILSTLDNHLKQREIVYPLTLLHKKKIQYVPFFSYPSGDWDEESIAFVSEAKYKGALTAHIGYNTSKTHQFLLNRVQFHENISNTPDLFWFRIFQAFLAGPKSGYPIIG